MDEFETCSWCTSEVLWTELEKHQTADGAFLCDVCWQDYVAPVETINTPTLFYGEGVVAVVYDEDGTVFDYAYNWESAQNYALAEGRLVRVVADDGGMTKDEIQRLCDAERDRFRDCFGVTS